MAHPSGRRPDVDISGRAVGLVAEHDQDEANQRNEAVDAFEEPRAEPLDQAGSHFPERRQRVNAKKAPSPQSRSAWCPFEVSPFDCKRLVHDSNL